MNSPNPLILTVDDDPLFNKFIGKMVEPLGVEVLSSTSINEFLKNLESVEPSLCLIDLNIGEPHSGFQLIEAVRKKLGFNVPLLVLSAISGRDAIAHAIELGANDFILKSSANREIIASKLAKYITTEGLISNQLPILPFPESQTGATVSIDLSILSIDEIGITIMGDHLITKGSDIWISGNIVSELTLDESRIRVQCISNSARSDNKYVAFLQFDLTNDRLLRSVRRWLLQKKNSAPA